MKLRRPRCHGHRNQPEHRRRNRRGLAAEGAPVACVDLDRETPKSARRPLRAQGVAPSASSRRHL